MRLAAITLAAIMAAGSVIAADRVINQSVDTATARVEPKGLYLFRGESVVYTVTPTRSGSEIRVTTNATARWYATTTTNVTLTVIDVTGSVATNGVATFTLSTNQTAMAAGTYDSFVQLSDTGSVLCASRATLTVFKSTFAQAVVPATNAYYLARTDPDGTTCVYTNGKLRVLSAGGTLNHASLTNLNGDVAYQHISTGRVALIDSALQPAATNGLASTGYVATALGGYLPTSTVYVAAESDPAWTAVSGSVAYAASLASYLPLAGGTMSGVLSMGAYTVDGQRFGNDAGYKASGNGWYAFGGSAGQGSTGDSWLAVGMVAGSMTLGNNWTAIGPYSGKSAAHTNSMAIGRFAGYGARGNNRMYLDVYGANPNYGFDGMATNDTIFMDSDGKLFLGGGGARAENPSAGGVLRGTWDIGAPTGSGAGLTNLSGAAIAAAGGLTNPAAFDPAGSAASATGAITAAWLADKGAITGAPWEAVGYVTGTPWTAEGYVTGTPWTAEGYVTGTPWAAVGYLTNSLGSFGTTVDGSGSVLTTGSVAQVIIPYPMTITKWMLVSDVSGSIVMDVRTNNVSLIGAGNKPTLSSMTTSNAAVSNWSGFTVNEGDIVEFVIESVATIKRINLVLRTTHN